MPGSGACLVMQSVIPLINARDALHTNTGKCAKMRPVGRINGKPALQPRENSSEVENKWRTLQHWNRSRACARRAHWCTKIIVEAREHVSGALTAVMRPAEHSILTVQENGARINSYRALATDSTHHNCASLEFHARGNMLHSLRRSGPSGRERECRFGNISNRTRGDLHPPDPEQTHRPPRPVATRESPARCITVFISLPVPDSTRHVRHLYGIRDLLSSACVPGCLPRRVPARRHRGTR